MILDSKCVVVTGGASGIGAALAQRFAAEGARVVVADVQEDTLRRVAGAIDAQAVRCDVTDEGDIAALVETAEQQYGPIDLFCSNAGIIVPGGAAATDREWERSLGRERDGSRVRGARCLLPRMLERGEGYFLQDCVGCGVAHAGRQRAVLRQQTRGARVRGVAGRSVTATGESRSRCSRRRRFVPR